MNENLAIILNPESNVTGGIINTQNVVVTVKKSELPKITNLFNKKIKIAIKPDKVKMGIDMNIINSFKGLTGFNNMVIQQTYVATVKKSLIKQCIDFYNNIDNLTKLIHEKETKQEDTFFNELKQTNQQVNNQVIPPVFPTTLSIPTNEPAVETPLVPVETGVNNTGETIQNEINNKDVSNNNENIPTFNIDSEKNLNTVLGNENSKIYDTSKINLSDIPEQSIDKQINNDGIGNGGHIKGALIAVIIVVLFIGSCVFLGYEMTKMSEIMPLIKDKYFS